MSFMDERDYAEEAANQAAMEREYLEEAGPFYIVEWVTTETQAHRASVDAETMAAMLGCSVETLRATDVTEFHRIDVRGLEDGLADVEDDDTQTTEYEFTREVTGIRISKQ